jgi:hypothetical protein
MSDDEHNGPTLENGNPLEITTALEKIDAV